MNINSFIDHTLLKPDTTSSQIAQLCTEAIENSFAAVCVNSYYVPFAVKMVKGSGVNVCTVVGFPLGASPKEVKKLEAEIAIENGATEIDMVLNIGALKDGLFRIVEEDIKTLSDLCHRKNSLLKVIFETCLLSNEEILKACELCVNAGADYVKTSTGFSTAGANLEVVKLMKQAVGEKAKVKASGGVKTLQDAIDMINIGAKRIGTSSGVRLVQGQSAKDSY